MSTATARVAVLRPLQSQIVFWAVCGLSAVYVVDAAFRGRVALTVRAGLILAFIVWCAWVFLWRMSVCVDGDGITARNLLRWVRVPWDRVADVRRRAQLRVEVDDGTHVDCWGSPFPPRTGLGGMTRTASPRGGRFGPGQHPAQPADRALHAVRGAWLNAAHRCDGAHDVTRGWDVPAVAAGGVLVVCAIVAVLV